MMTRSETTHIPVQTILIDQDSLRSSPDVSQRELKIDMQTHSNQHKVSNKIQSKRKRTKPLCLKRSIIQNKIDSDSMKAAGVGETVRSVRGNQKRRQRIKREKGIQKNMYNIY